MANTPGADGQRRLGEPPSQVRVTVILLPRDHSTRRQRLDGRYARVALAAAAVAALVAVVLGGGGRSPAARATVTDGGPAGVAAAFGYPTSCLRVRISAANETFARADIDRGRYCGFQTSFPTAIFRRFGGEWHPLVYAFIYPCPVPSVPAAVQTQLTLCPQRPR